MCDSHAACTCLQNSTLKASCLGKQVTSLSILHYSMSNIHNTQVPIIDT